MPAEQIYQPQVDPGATPGAPMASPADFGAGVGAAISGVGEAGVNLALTERQLQRNEENAAAGLGLQKAIAATQDYEHLDRDGKTEGWQPRGAGHQARVLKTFDDQATVLLDGVTDPKARAALAERIQANRNSIADRTDVFEAGQRVAGFDQDSKGLVAAVSSRLGRSDDPADIGDGLDDLHASIDAMDAPPEAKELVLHNAELQAKSGFLLGQADRNPDRVASYIASGTFDGLGEAHLATIQNSADAEIHRRAIAVERIANEQKAAQKQNEELLLRQVGDGTLVDGDALAVSAKAAADRGDKVRAYDLQVAQTKNVVNRVYGGGNASPDQITSALAAIEKDKGWQAKPERVIQHSQLTTLLEQQRKAEPNFEPLDFANPAAIQQQVAAAHQWAASHNGELYILGKDQAETMGHLASGGPAGRMQVASALSQIPGQDAISAAQQVAKGDYALQQAISIPPNFRSQLFEGEALLKATPALAPKAKIDARWGERGRIAMGHLPAEAQNAVLAGATNVYAYRAAQKGLTEFDQTLWDNTVNDMIDPSGKGGIGMWGRKPFVLPQGMPENELMARLYNMPEEHLGTYYSDHKTPLSKSALLNRYSPVPIGDGIYRWVDKDGRYAAGRRGIAELDVRKLPLPAPTVIPGGVPKGPIWVAPPSAPANPNDPYVLMSRGGAGH